MIAPKWFQQAIEPLSSNNKLERVLELQEVNGFSIVCCLPIQLQVGFCGRVAFSLMGSAVPSVLSDVMFSLLIHSFPVVF